MTTNPTSYILIRHGKPGKGCDVVTVTPMGETVANYPNRWEAKPAAKELANRLGLPLGNVKKGKGGIAGKIVFA